jgi:hypothetical protein
MNVHLQRLNLYMLHSNDHWWINLRAPWIAVNHSCRLEPDIWLWSCCMTSDTAHRSHPQGVDNNENRWRCSRVILLFLIWEARLVHPSSLPKANSGPPWYMHRSCVATPHDIRWLNDGSIHLLSRHAYASVACLKERSRDAIRSHDRLTIYYPIEYSNINSEQASTKSLQSNWPAQ